MAHEQVLHEYRVTGSHPCAVVLAALVVGRRDARRSSNHAQGLRDVGFHRSRLRNLLLRSGRRRRALRSSTRLVPRGRRRPLRGDLLGLLLVRGPPQSRVTLSRRVTGQWSGSGLVKWIYRARWSSRKFVAYLGGVCTEDRKRHSEHLRLEPIGEPCVSVCGCDEGWQTRALRNLLPQALRSH